MCDIVATIRTEIALKSQLVYTHDVMMQLERDKITLKSATKVGSKIACVNGLYTTLGAQCPCWITPSIPMKVIFRYVCMGLFGFLKTWWFFIQGFLNLPFKATTSSDTFFHLVSSDNNFFLIDFICGIISLIPFLTTTRFLSFEFPRDPSPHL